MQTQTSAKHACTRVLAQLTLGGAAVTFTPWSGWLWAREAASNTASHSECTLLEVLVCSLHDPEGCHLNLHASPLKHLWTCPELLLFISYITSRRGQCWLPHQNAGSRTGSAHLSFPCSCLRCVSTMPWQ